MRNASRHSILLVEDDFLIANLEKTALEREGYSVMHSNGGEQALNLLFDIRLPCDLILMDINLGVGQSGIAIARTILSEKDIPIIFLSSHTANEMQVMTEGVASFGVIEKLGSIPFLAATISLALEFVETKKQYGLSFDYLDTGFCINKLLYGDSGNPIDSVFLNINAAMASSEGLSRKIHPGSTVAGNFPPKDATRLISLFSAAKYGKSLLITNMSLGATGSEYRVCVAFIDDDTFAIFLKNKHINRDSVAGAS